MPDVTSGFNESANADFIPLDGSDRPKRIDVVLTPAPPDELLDVTITIRRKQNLPPFRSHVTISREEYAAKYGAAPDEVAKVRDFVENFGLKVDHDNPGRRGVWVSGTVAQFDRAFRIELKSYKAGTQSDAPTYRVREGPLFVPRNLEEIIESVDGLTNEPIAKPHVLSRRVISHPAATPRPGLTPGEIATRYNFPTDASGSNQVIGILELGGGYNPKELTQYFSAIGAHGPPVIVDCVAHGLGSNQPGGDSDAEVLLDVMIAGGVAPGAKIIMYFGLDASGQSFLDALTSAIHDSVNKPGIISISWGGPEINWTAQLSSAFDQILEAAAHLQITVCVAAGDNASADFDVDDSNWNGQAYVDFPAASPFALACGGTEINDLGAVQNEVVWHSSQNVGTGGGVSRLFPLPDYQKTARVPQRSNPLGPIQRGIPDVAGNASPATGYSILCDGSWRVLGGTSAVAPLWAGLIALINEKLGREVGFLNPFLYQLGASSKVFNDVVTGNNGDYQAGPGWDPCTGLGTPNGLLLFAALSGQTTTGTSETVQTRAKSAESLDARRLEILAQYFTLTEKLLDTLDSMDNRD